MSTTIPLQRRPRRVTLSAASGQTVFSYTDQGPIWDAADVVVKRRTAGETGFAVVTSGYAVTVLGTTGAQVTFAVAPRASAAAPAVDIRIESRRVASRTTDVTRQQRIHGPSMDLELDRNVTDSQEQRRDIDDLQARALLLSETGNEPEYWSLGDRPLRDIGDPVLAGDAVTLRYLDAANGALRGYVDAGDAGERAYAEQLVAGVVGGHGAFQGDASGAIVRTFQDKMRDSVSAKDFGARGDGVTDDTAALLAAFNSGVPVMVPPGVYMVDMIRPTGKVSLNFMPGAVLKLRRAPTTPAGTINAVLWIDGAAANGSSVRGLEIDGNRTALQAGHSTAAVWIGLRITNCDDISVTDLYVHDVATHALFFQTGKRWRISNVKVTRSAQAMALSLITDVMVRGLHCSDISNAGFSTWQHVWEINSIWDFVFSDWTCIGYFPDGAGLDALCLVFTASRLFRGHISNMICKDYTGTHPAGSMGFSISGGTDVVVHGLLVDNFDNLVEINGADRIWIDGFEVRGRYRTAAVADFGIKISNVGYDYTWTGALDYLMNAGAKDVTLSNGLVHGCNVNVRLLSEGTKFQNVKILGAKQYGIIVGAPNGEGSTMFPNAPRPYMGRHRFDRCEFSYSGYSGALAWQVDDVEFADCSARGNGNAAAPIDAAGLLVSTNANNVRIVGGDFDAGAWTDTVSFKPGATTGQANEYVVQIVPASKIGLGQRLLITNGGGPGVNITGYVSDIFGNNVKLAVRSGAATFSDSGNLTALTGTVTISGYTMTGTGTLFTTELTKRTWIKIGSLYYMVAQVVSNTVARLDSAYPAVSTPSAAAKIVCTVTAVATQANHVLIQASATAVFLNARYYGASTGAAVVVEAGSQAAMAAGSRLPVDGPSIAVPAGTETTIFGGATDKWKITDLKINSSGVTYSGGTNSVRLRTISGGSYQDDWTLAGVMSLNPVYNAGVTWRPALGGTQTVTALVGAASGTATMQVRAMIEKTGVDA